MNEVQVVNVYHYPYWWGSPYWYPYPYWRPYPVSYHWGFYVGPNGAAVRFGTPSFHFTYWHFNNYNHYHRYPHYSSHLVGHYYRHPGWHGGSNNAVSGWLDDNRDRFPQDWSVSRNRADRFRDYGEFERRFDQRNRMNPGSQVSREQFLRENRGNYPNLQDRAQVGTLGRVGARQNREGLSGQRPGVTTNRPNVGQNRNITRPDVNRNWQRDIQRRQGIESHRGSWNRTQRNWNARGGSARRRGRG